MFSQVNTHMFLTNTASDLSKNFKNILQMVVGVIQGLRRDGESDLARPGLAISLGEQGQKCMYIKYVPLRLYNVHDKCI